MITIIPAIDIIDGKCVRLTKGDYSLKKNYNNSPVDTAKSFEDAGIKRLHLVDLDGAKRKRIVHWQILENISTSTNLKIDFGGGIRKEKDLKIAFNSGANQVTVGSIAVTNSQLVELWLKIFGSDRIILGADVINGNIAINAWQEESNIDINSFIGSYSKSGIKNIICTDVEKDGVLKGPSFQLYENLKNSFPNLKIIASGGISNVNDIEKLNNKNIDGVIIGKAIYEKRIELKKLEKFLC